MVAPDAGVDEWAGRVVTLLSGEGLDKPVGLIQAERKRPQKDKPTVVVAGEDKRGKSSLVNALLRRPGLSPIGVEVTTGTPITFYKSKVETAFLLHYDDSERHPADFDEARNLATVQGNPGNEHNLRGVLLGVDCPLLDDLVLVDTPGVGGLQSGHAALTLTRLRDADALLFVLEAGAQFRAPELAFLEQASERIDRVIFALTKVDAYRGWQQIMQDNRHILAERAPRFAKAPMIGVSNTLAQRAMKLEGDMAGELLRESGIVNIERAIVEEVVAHAGQLKAANLLQTGLGPLTRLRRQIEGEIEALTSPEKAEEMLVAERQRLAELNQERADWPMVMSTELRRLSLDRGEEISRGLMELRSSYEERLKKIKITEEETLPGEFVADVTALVSRVNEWTEDRFITLLVNLVGDIEKSAELAGSLRQVTDAAFAEELAGVTLGEHSLDTSEKIGVVQSYTSGHMMTSLLGTGAVAILGGPVGLAIGIMAGGAMAFTRFKSSKKTNYTREFSSWMGEQTQRTQIAVTNSFMRTQIDLETGIRETLKAAFTERDREISAAIATCQEAARQEQGERQNRRKVRQAKLEAVRTLEQQGSSFLSNVWAPHAPAAPAVAGT